MRLECKFWNTYYKKCTTAVEGHVRLISDSLFSLSSSFRKQNENFHILLNNCCAGINFLGFEHYKYQMFSARRNWVFVSLHFETAKRSPIEDRKVV